MIRKFRAICKNKRRFEYGSLIYSKDGSVFIKSFETDKEIEVAEKSISQYIGQVDKRGNEIYEGHILYNNEDLTAVKIEYNSFLVETKYGTDEEELIPVSMFDFSRYEIVAFTNELLD